MTKSTLEKEGETDNTAELFTSEYNKQVDGKGKTAQVVKKVFHSNPPHLDGDPMGSICCNEKSAKTSKTILSVLDIATERVDNNTTHAVLTTSDATWPKVLTIMPLSTPFTPVSMHHHR